MDHQWCLSWSTPFFFRWSIPFLLHWKGMEKPKQKRYASRKKSLTIHTVGLQPGVNYFQALKTQCFGQTLLTLSWPFPWSILSWYWQKYMYVYQDFFWPHCAELARKQGLCKCYILIEMIKSQRRGMEKACSNQIKITVQWRSFFIYLPKKNFKVGGRKWTKVVSLYFPCPSPKLTFAVPVAC